MKSIDFTARVLRQANEPKKNHRHLVSIDSAARILALAALCRGAALRRGAARARLHARELAVVGERLQGSELEVRRERREELEEDGAPAWEDEAADDS